MVTIRERIKWELYCRKSYYLTLYGLSKGLIKAYTDDSEVMERFRNTYYGGIPLSIILLCLNWTRGLCYDKALLVAYAFRDCEDVCMIDADTQGISLNLANIDYFRSQLGYLPEHYDNHCLVEVKDKDGITWAYDTTKGYIIEKSLFYKIEKPVITKINNKQDILNYPEYQDMLKQDLEHDKYALPCIIPMVEMIIDKEKENDRIYSNVLQSELDRFKEQIDYEKIYKERYEYKKLDN